MLKCEKCIHKKICIDGANYRNAEVCRNFVNENDFTPVVHGRWIPISDGAWAECSECGEACDVSDNGGMTAFELFCDCYKYCPNCGAKMDGGDENV